MTELLDENPQILAALHELFTSATHDASAAMCRWTDGVVSVTLDEVRQVPLEEIGARLDVGDALLTMIVMTLGGELGGSLIVLFDEISGRRLAASLLGRAPEADSPWSDLEQSALAETGNILGCAYVNALTRLIGADLVPSPPSFIQDFGVSVLQQAVMPQAMAGDSLLFCDIAFHRKGEKLDWRVVFVPAPELQEAIERSLHAAR